MNLEHVKTIVIAADGRLSETALDAREQALFEVIDTAIRANPNFLTELPDAILEHVESMRGIKETDDGRLYLRYRTSKNPVPLEFWGCIAKISEVDWVTGFVHVTEEDLELEVARESTRSEATIVAIPTPETQITSPGKPDQTKVKIRQELE
jgi:hypothetical protein